ncbi:uncharacterized protein LOC108841384 [Raphanus sativus]|uniref:Uncharacterized protein LOC108841384 n=1 Tax=Raphanus sativus TaxID=3726 RepID=A0A9W3CMN0_RAPSA|nr:uncharacterized protein LOC108841384 [Raphanus sativus]
MSREEEDDPMGIESMATEKTRITKRRLSSSKNSRTEMTRSFDDIDKLLNLDFTSFQGFSSRMDHLVSLDATSWAIEILYSWNTYHPGIIDQPRKQVLEDCWSYSFSRGQSSLVKRLESPRKILTQKAIFYGVDEKCISEDGGLIDFELLVRFLKENDYVEDMILHEKEGDDPEQYFGNLIRRLLGISPIVICIDCPPSFESFTGTRGIYTPLEVEIEATRFESFTQHSFLLTGHGLVIYNGVESVRFLEFQDSQGKDWGENGFLKIANIYPFIKNVIEFKV